MAEMADLTSALNKLEVTKKLEEEKASPPAEQPKKSEESPPASSDKPAEEASPPASSDKPEEKKSPPPREEEPSAQPEGEEVTHKLGSSKAAEDPSPPESKQLKDSADDDLLEFTSATEGEASSSAWELVPEQKIARKKGVKSDSDMDSMLKKAIKEAEQPLLAKNCSQPHEVSSTSGSLASCSW